MRRVDRTSSEKYIARFLAALALLLAALLPAAVRVAAAPQTQLAPLPQATAQADLPTPQVQGQSRIAMAVRGGYGDEGRYVIGEWFPVYVSLANPSGGQSMRVRVEVDSRGDSGSPNSALGSYVREVDLPPQSRKEVTLYAYSTSYISTLDVRLVHNGTIIGSSRAALSGQEQTYNIIVGVVSPDASLLNLLGGERVGFLPTPFYSRSGYGGPPAPVGTQEGARVVVAHLRVEEIPTLSAALNSLGVLVLEGTDLSALSDEQQEAVLAWVVRGGTLVVAARPGASELSSGLADYLPVSVGGGSRNLPSLKGLSDLVAVPLTPTTAVAVAEATLRTEPEVGANLLAAEDGLPLVASRDLGEGQVVYMGLSPALPPLKSWEGTAPLFKRLLAEHRLGHSFGSIINSPGYSYGYGYPGSGVFDVYGSIFDLPGLELPDATVMAIFLMLYILIVGPLNFVILRRLRKPELAWATIPALVLVFSVGAYLLGYQSKGGDLVMVRGSVAYSAPEVPSAQAMQVVGLFSPLRGTYSLNVGAESVAYEMNSYNYGGGASDVPARTVGGETTSLENVIVNTGSLKGYVTHNAVRAEAPLEVDLRLGQAQRQGNDRVEGSVRNRSGGGLQDVALMMGNRVQYIGYMAPGESKQVNLQVSIDKFPTGSSSILLPPPAGVTAGTSGGGYGYSTGPASDAQREYNRKVHLLNMALEPLVSDDAVTDFSVFAFAWGADAPVTVEVPGKRARTHELTLWTTRAKVLAARGETQPELDGDSVPLWTYAPGNRGLSTFAGSPTNGFDLEPYADIHFSLPMGAKPERMTIAYDTGGRQLDNVAWLGYNVRTGRWDSFGTVSGAGEVIAGVNQRGIALPSAADYVSPGGDVTLRLLASSPMQGLSLSPVQLLVNPRP